MLFSEALSKFARWKGNCVKLNTVRSYDLILRHFCVFIHNCDIGDVTLDKVLEWFDLMRLVGYENNTFIPRAIALRKFFEFYQHQGYHVIDPFLIPVPDHEFTTPRIADEENYKKLLASIPCSSDGRHIRNRAIINLLWDTGARIGELLNLNVEDLDLINNRTVVKTEKARSLSPHQVRELFWSSRTNNSIKHWLEKREHLEKERFVFKDPQALFISIMAGQYRTQGRRFKAKGADEMLRRYCLRAHIPTLNPHSFRHHVGHDLAIKGANNSIISSVLGHSSLQSSYVYTMLRNKELESVYRKLRGIH